MSKTTEPYLTGFWVDEMLEMLREAARDIEEYRGARMDGYELHLDVRDTPRAVHVIIDARVLERVYDRILDDIKGSIDLLFAEGEIYFPLVSFFAKASLDEFEGGEQVEGLLRLCVEFAKEH